jgi:hypothetical protein
VEKCRSFNLWGLILINAVGNWRGSLKILLIMDERDASEI